jgi:hypothetical protein
MKMKTIINKYLSKIAVISFLVFALLISFSTETNAQFRVGFGGRSFAHIPHYSTGYYSVRAGSFFAPRIGARFTVLPYGYTTFWIGGFPYYYYDGFWFEYFPAYGYYAVVNKPAEVNTAQQNQKFDRVILKDGSSMEGIFEGATDGAIILRVGNEDHSININDIVSIHFAPAIPDSAQTK